MINAYSIPFSTNCLRLLQRIGAGAFCSLLWWTICYPASSTALPPERLLSLDIEELGSIKIDTVFGASKASEKVTDAPSSVTIVTRDEIQRFGYRTLSDVVRATRSFDVTYDRNYAFSSVRGFTSQEDYGSRTLILIDGHRMNDPIFDTAAIGTEGLLDVDLIERVEFIRGPGSALYGSNAFFGVINVITRSGDSVNGVEASATGGSFESYSGRFTLGKKLKNGLEYLISGTTAASAGDRHLYYPEFDSPENNHGVATNLDGDRYYSTMGKVSYGDFTLQGGYVSRDKDVPTAPYETVFNAPNNTIDSRGYLELRYAHETESGWSLTGRAGYDSYDYHWNLPYEVDGERVINNDSARAHWLSAAAGATRTFFNQVRFTFGAEARQSSELSLRNYDNHPYTSYLDASSEQTVLGAFADGRWEITKKLSLGAGLSWDHYNSFGSVFNPRASLIWKPREGTALKLLYGQAFRAPNIYQLDYLTLGQLPSRHLEPETIRTYELAADQYVGQHWRGTMSLFRNEISSLIESVSHDDGSFQFANASDAVVNGAEAEVEGKWDNGLLVRASYTYQLAEGENGERIGNSPRNLLKGHISVPLLRNKVFGSLELLYAGERETLGGHRTGDMWLLNGTLFSRELLPGLEVSASIYNLLGQKYGTPGGVEHSQDTIPQDGRTFRLKATYRF